MKTRYSTDPRFSNPNSATRLLAKQLMESGDGRINNVGEGINSAVGSLTGAWLQNKSDSESAQKQKDYYDTLNSLQMLNKEAGGSNEDLINAMAASSNPFVSQDAQTLKSQIMAEQLKPQNPETVGAGGALVDPKTGKVIYNNPNQPGRAPALISTVDEYMNASPEKRAVMDKFAKVYEKNTYMDADGNLQPIPNALPTITNISYAKESGSQQAEKDYIAPKLQEEEQAKQDISDRKVAPLINNLLTLNDKTFDMPYAGAINGVARIAPGTNQQTTAMDLMQQARLEMAAPLAKQLGVNPTDKDFQASLDRIFNANSTKESRKQQILALQRRYLNRQNGISGNANPMNNQNTPIDYKSKYGLQ